MPNSGLSVPAWEPRSRLTTVFFIKSCLLAEGIAAVFATLPPLAASAFRFLLSHKQLQVPTSSKGLPPEAPAWRDPLPFAVPQVPHSRSGNDCMPSAPALLLQQAIGREGPGTPDCTKHHQDVSSSQSSICLKGLKTLLQRAKIQIS